MEASRAFPGGLLFGTLLFVLLSSQTATASVRLCPSAANNADACGKFSFINDIACAPTQCNAGLAYSPGAISLFDGRSSIIIGDVSTDISDPDNCCQVCSNTPACDAWTYDTVNGRCSILTSGDCSSRDWLSAGVLLPNLVNPRNSGLRFFYHGSRPTNPRCQAPSEACPGAIQAKCVASPIRLPATTDCAVPASVVLGQVNAGSLMSDGTLAQTGDLSLTLTDGTSFTLGDHSVRLTVTDGTAQRTCDATVTIFDNEPDEFVPTLLNCFGSPAGTVTKVTPSQASPTSPAIFTASYAKPNGCGSASVSIRPGSVTCTRCNKPGQSQKPGCIVSTEGGTVSIANSGGAGNYMTWEATVTAPAGPSGSVIGTGVCGVCVGQPSGQKEICKQWVPGGKVPGC